MDEVDDNDDDDDDVDDDVLTGALRQRRSTGPLLPLSANWAMMKMMIVKFQVSCCFCCV